MYVTNNKTDMTVKKEKINLYETSLSERSL